MLISRAASGLVLACALIPALACAQADPLGTASLVTCERSAGHGVWEPGVDYVLLVPPKEVAVAPGKIELGVRFLYTGEVYREMENRLRKWKKPDYVEIVHRPAIKWPHARLFAQMFYTLEKLGRAEELHQKLFEWIWQPDHYPIYHTIEEPDTAGIHRLNREFAGAHGIEPETFDAIYFSKAIHSKVLMEAAKSHDDGALFTVNGRYGTDYERVIRGQPQKYGTPENFARLLQLIECLAASEHQGMQESSRNVP